MAHQTQSNQKIVDPNDFKSAFLGNKTLIYPFSFEMEDEEVPQTEAEAAAMALSEVIED